MRLATLALVLSLITPSLADGKPRQTYSTSERALKLAKARKAAKRAAERLAHLEAVEVCIGQRTDDGLAEDQAAAICDAEVE